MTTERPLTITDGGPAFLPGPPPALPYPRPLPEMSNADIIEFCRKLNPNFAYDANEECFAFFVQHAGKPWHLTAPKTGDATQDEWLLRRALECAANTLRHWAALTPAA